MNVRNALLATALAFGIMESTNIPDAGAPAIVFGVLFYACALWLWRRNGRAAAALLGVLFAVESTQAQTWKDAGHGVKWFAMGIGSVGIALAGAFLGQKALKLASPIAAVAALTLLAGSAAAAPAQQTLRFVSVQQSFAQDAPAPTIGSRLFFSDAIYNKVPQFGKPAGARVGRDEGVCTIVTMRYAQCVVTAHVPNGQIVVMGGMRLSQGPATNHFAIVGGAGDYGTARGTVLSRDVSQTKSLVTLKLSA
jgi:hypothetical protein